MGADDQRHMRLMTSQDLAVAIDSLADETENLVAEVMRDGKGTSKVLDLRSYVTHANQYHYVVTLNKPVKNLGMITEKQALALLK